MKKLRIEFGLSQKELSEKLQIAHSTLACYETNKRQVPYDVLIAIAKLFDVTTDTLLGIEK